MSITRGFFLLFFATLAFSIPLRGDHILLRLPQNHFFPPSRTLFFFRPDLYVQSHLHSTSSIYAPPLHFGRHHESGADAHWAASQTIYLLAVVGPIDTEIVRANSSDLIFQVHPAKALVFIDGLLIGSARDFATQRDRYTILDGQHDLRIEAPGYQPYHTEMKITANRTLHLDIELEPLE